MVRKLDPSEKGGEGPTSVMSVEDRQNVTWPSPVAVDSGEEDGDAKP